MSVSKKPMVLVILDGYGYREEQQDNAIFSAKTPVMDALWANRPHTLIDASGLEVGLPDRQMGNSEVGHVNLGAGRIVYQDLTRLDVEIKDRAFFANPVLTGAVDKAKNAGKAVHIMGLLSAGGVHSHEDHIMAMVELAAERGAEKIYLHAFLDGRDTPPRSAESSLKKFEEKFAALGKGRVASIIGRYYAMDRDNRWDRVEKAYDLLTLAQGEFQADTAVAGLQAAYARDENDEFVKATVIRAEGQPDAAMEDGDALIFMNFRADRAREITRAFVNADFDGFARKKVVNVDFVMLTEYAADIKTAVAYPPASLVNTFGVSAAAAVGIAGKFEGFAMLPATALSSAIASMAAQNIGAGLEDRARRALLYGVLSSLVAGLIMGWAAFFHGDVLAGIFADDRAVIAAAWEYLKAYAIDCLLTSFLFCFVGFFNGCGQTLFVMVQGMIGALCVRLPVALLVSWSADSSLFHLGLATPASTTVQIILCGI